jgi:anaerobic selenocysteine-containing dehydrogenase
VCVAGNPVLTTPNGERLARALAELELVVAVDYYVNETTRHAHYILPPQHAFETGNFDLLLSRFTVRNVAKYSAPIVETDDDTRDDWDILSDLAARMVLPGPLHRACRRFGRDLPERVIDVLLRLGPARLSMRALCAAPHGIDLGPLVPSHGEHVRTADRRVRLAPPALAADVPRLETWVDEQRAAGGLVMVGRRHLRSNNSWMNGLPSLAKGPDRARLLVHPADAARLGVKDGDSVGVRSRTGRVAAVVRVTDEVMPGVVSLPHGFAHCSANAITDDYLVEPVIGTSILNGVPVVLEAAVEGSDAS